MTLDEIKERWTEIIKKQNNLKGRILDDFSECPELFVEIYGYYPNWYYLECQNDVDKTVENIRKNFKTYIPRTFISYKMENGDAVFDEHSYDSNIFTENGYIFINRDGMTVYADNSEFAEEVFKSMSPIQIENPCEVYWVSQGNGGFGATKLTLKDGKFDVAKHYNVDFDYNKVVDFINGPDSGITILHGEPGTGKTYLLRHLAQTNPERKFYFMDKSTFAYIGQSSFISFLLDRNIKDSVFVLEDCEVLLRDRINGAGGNELLSSVLNLSDGILGDGLHIKFICTFNADLSVLDKALLRKGRLKYKYEFKKLTPDKTQELAKELGKNIPEDKSLAVCEIYNWDYDNNGGQIKRNKIGFN